MLNLFFSKSEFRPLKFGLNSNFIYIFVENLKQFAFDVCTVGLDEGHSYTPGSSLSTVQSTKTSSHVALYCRRLTSAVCLGHQDLSL